MNKNVLLITGASSSIGQEVIKKFIRKNDIIIATFNKKNFTVDKTLQSKIIKFKVDFNNKDELEKFIYQLNKKSLIPNKILHIASNNLKMSSLHNLDWLDYEKTINIQVRSLFTILKNFLPIMKKKKSGKIVAILSSVVYGSPPGSMSQYVTAKYALQGLLRSAASEFSKYQININSISPGMMRTDFLSEVPDKILEINQQKVPFGRNVEIKDLLPIIDLLLTDNSKFITGIDIPVTGGLNY